MEDPNKKSHLKTDFEGSEEANPVDLQKRAFQSEELASAKAVTRLSLDIQGRLMSDQSKMGVDIQGVREQEARNHRDLGSLKNVILSFCMNRKKEITRNY